MCCSKPWFFSIDEKSPEKAEGMAIADNRNMVRAGRGDGYGTSEVQASFVKGPDKDNRVAVSGRNKIGARR